MNNMIRTRWQRPLRQFAFGFTLPPGDTAFVGFYRTAASPTDSCVGEQLITGIRVTYP